MNASAIIDLISKVIQTAVSVGPTVIQTVEDAAPFAKAIYDNLVSGTAVTQAQLDALEARLTELSDELQQPLPPATP